MSRDFDVLHALQAPPHSRTSDMLMLLASRRWAPERAPLRPPDPRQ
jgi:hypothetical protein